MFTAGSPRTYIGRHCTPRWAVVGMFTDTAIGTKGGNMGSRTLGAVHACVAAMLVGAATAAAAADATTAPAETLGEIVITGSRVITNGNNSPTPVTVVTAEDMLKVQPSTISDGLNMLPVFSGPRNQLSNPNANVGSGGGGNGVASMLNLRNLGPQRTLVLLDGHRVPPTTSTGVVDSDMIPQLLLKRVDVVTGGVSAVYGSDAIAGVVNFVTDRSFNGLRFSLQSGVSEQHDDRQVEAGIAGGTNIGSRMHIEGSYEYRDDKGILNRSARPGVAWWTVQGNGGTATPVIPYFLTGDAVRADMTFGGLIRSGALNNQQFNAGGVLSAQVLGAATGNAATRLGGDGVRYDASLKAPLRSHQLFGRLDYDFSDRLHGYAEFAGNRKRNEIFANWPTLANVQIDARDAFLPAAVTSQYTANTTFNFSKMINTAPRLNPEIDETQVSLQAGIEGQLGAYRWNAAYAYGNAVLDNKEIANVNNLRLAAALDAVTDSSGQVVCKVTRDNPGLFPGCVPLNVFGPGAESAAGLNYVLGNPTYKASTRQHDLSAGISGEAFGTWAGPFRAALSAEWRRQDYHADSSDPPVPYNCAASGLRYNCTGLTYADPDNPTSATRLIPQYANSFSSRSPVSQTVSEGAIEFVAPLLAAKPAVTSLDLNGAVRFTHYDTSGSYTTWKAGLDWHINDSLRLRGTRSRDIRAPTLDDLFSPFYGQVVSIQDVLLATTSNAYRFELGNPGLKAEVGNTTTVGVVFQPRSLSGFSASLDYYDIGISDAISQIQGTNPVFQRACYSSGGTSPYCSLQLRTLGSFSPVSTNIVTQWRSGFLNISALRTRGADLELNYSAHVGTHPLAVRALATYQPHIYYDTPGLVTVDQGGVAFGPGGLQASPSTRVTAMLHFGVTERVSADLLTRQRGSLAMTGDPSLITTGQKVPAVSYTNLTLNYAVPQGSAGRLDVYLNVQNVFNEPAPPANVNSTPVQIGLLGGFAIGDDPVGRYYSLGLRYGFGR